MYKINIKRIAFTLAEVLISLGIIGVVCAMTIPTLIANTQHAEYVTALKKFYTNFNQVLSQIANDSGCPGNLECTGLFATGTTHATLGDELVKYVKVTKNCRTDTTTDAACWPVNTNEVYNGTGTNYNYNNDSAYKFITADGMSIWMQNYANDCNTPTYSNNPALGYMTQTCGTIVVDVNGLKEPNYYGRDTFFFFITNGKGTLLYPQGGADDKYGGTEYWWDGATKRCIGANNDGFYCAGRIIEQGWQMTY